MKTARYYISNGFHGTTTYIMAEPRVGALISPSVMEAAKRRLCPSRHNGCVCIGSPAASPLPHQDDGFLAHPGLHVEDHDFDGAGAVAESDGERT